MPAFSNMNMHRMTVSGSRPQLTSARQRRQGPCRSDPAMPAEARVPHEDREPNLDRSTNRDS
jgi:hypothetical protein